MPTGKPHQRMRRTARNPPPIPANRKGRRRLIRSRPRPPPRPHRPRRRPRLRLRRPPRRQAPVEAVFRLPPCSRPPKTPKLSGNVGSTPTILKTLSVAISPTTTGVRRKSPATLSTSFPKTCTTPRAAPTRRPPCSFTGIPLMSPTTRLCSIYWLGMILNRNPAPKTATNSW